MENEVRLGFRPDDSFRSLINIIREDPESPHRQLKEEKEKKVQTAPQNMRTAEEPEVPAEEVDNLEDYDKEDFNKPGKKVKSKTPGTDLGIKEEPENKQQILKDSKQEGDLYLCNNCCKTFRSLDESCPDCFSNIVERIVTIQEATPVQGDWFDDKNPDPEPEQKPEHEMETVAGEENWDYTFRYSHNQIGSNPLEDKSGNPIIWHTHPRMLGGRKIRVFTDYQENWAKGQGAIPVRETPFENSQQNNTVGNQEATLESKLQEYKTNSYIITWRDKREETDKGKGQKHVTNGYYGRDENEAKRRFLAKWRGAEILKIELENADIDVEESKLQEAEDISALQARRLEIEQQMLDSEKEYKAEQNRMGSEVDALNQQINAAEGKEAPWKKEESEEGISNV